MALQKTTILPTDDAALAQAMLRDWIEKQPHVLWITLGNDADAALTAERGDGMAGKPTELRWCVWVRDVAAVDGVISGLKLGKWKLSQVKGARAFTMSRDDEVRDVMPPSKPVPSFTRAMAAFMAAEA